MDIYDTVSTVRDVGKMTGKAGKLGKLGKFGKFGKIGGKGLAKVGGGVFRRGLTRAGTRAAIKIGGKAGGKLALKTASIGTKVGSAALPVAMIAGGAMGGISGYQNAGVITGKGDAATTSDKVSSTLLGTGIGILTLGLLPEEWSNAAAGGLYKAGAAAGEWTADTAIAAKRWIQSDQASANAEEMERIRIERVNRLGQEQQRANQREIERLKAKQARGHELTETEKLRLNRNTDEGERAYQEHISNKENLAKMDSTELNQVTMLAENELTRERAKTQATTDASTAKMAAASTKDDAGFWKRSLRLVTGDVAAFTDDVPEILKNKKFREMAEGPDIEKAKKANKMLSQEVKNLQRERDSLSGWNFITRKKYDKQIANLREYHVANINRVSALEKIKKKEEEVRTLKEASEKKEAEENAEEGLTPDNETTGNAESNMDITVEEGQAIEHKTVADQESSEMTGETTNEEKPGDKTLTTESVSSGMSEVSNETKQKADELQQINKEVTAAEVKKTETNAQAQQIFIQELQKRDTALETYLNPESPVGINKVLENNMTKIANNMQTVYSFPQTRTDNISLPTTIV